MLLKTAQLPKTNSEKSIPRMFYSPVV